MASQKGLPLTTMALPNLSLPTATVAVGGSPIEYRSLSRSEAMHFLTAFTVEAMPDSDVEARANAAEAWLIATACGASIAEANAFRDNATADDVRILVDAIINLSGLNPNEDDKDPKADTNENS